MRHLLLFLTLFILSACTDENIFLSENDRYSENRKVILTPEEYVSIAYDNPRELSEEEILNVVADFQQTLDKTQNLNITRNMRNLNVQIKEKYYISNNNDQSSLARSQKAEEITVPIFEVEFSNDDKGKSFAVVCGDERAPKVIFYANDYDPAVKMNLQTRHLFELTKKTLLADVNSMERIKKEKRDSTLCKIARILNVSTTEVCFDNMKEQIEVTDVDSKIRSNPIGGTGEPQTNVVAFVKPLSKVTWNQETPYCDRMPWGWTLDGGIVYEGNFPVGCANVAIGTLFTIVRPSISVDNKPVDWDYVTSVPYIYTSPFPGAGSPSDLVNIVSGLLSNIATGTHTFFNYVPTKTYDENGNEITINAVADSETYADDMINYLRGFVNFSGDMNTHFDANQAKISLFNKKPVMLFGSGWQVNYDREVKSEAPGHVWLIDGYIMTKRSGQAVYDNYWSVNMGWGRDKSKGYFRTSDNFQDCDVIFDSGGAYYYQYNTQEQNMIYNISRK